MFFYHSEAYASTVTRTVARTVALSSGLADADAAGREEDADVEMLDAEDDEGAEETMEADMEA